MYINILVLSSENCYQNAELFLENHSYQVILLLTQMGHLI